MPPVPPLLPTQPRGVYAAAAATTTTDAKAKDFLWSKEKQPHTLLGGPHGQQTAKKAHASSSFSGTRLRLLICIGTAHFFSASRLVWAAMKLRQQASSQWLGFSVQVISASHCDKKPASQGICCLLLQSLLCRLFGYSFNRSFLGICSFGLN
ncbi:hypothetical protein FKM82_017327 [Ascaphus truei]